MAGLFTTPEQVRQAQQQRIMEQAQVYDNPIARAAYQANAGLVGSIGGLFGAQPQGVAQAQQVQQIASSVQFDEDKDPESYYTELSRKLINAGLTQAGSEALALAQKAKPSSSYTEKLTAGDKTAIREATSQSQTARIEAQDAVNLAIDYLETRPTGGFLGSAFSAFREFIGDTNEVDLLKKRFNKLRMTGVLSNLPPGPASDKDIEQANKGFPTERFGAEEIATWLRGYAKAKKIEAGYRDFYAQYVDDNFGSSAGVNKAWKKHFEENVELYWQDSEKATAKETAEEATTPAKKGEVNWVDMGATTAPVAPPPKLTAEQITQEQFEEQTNPFSL